MRFLLRTGLLLLVLAVVLGVLGGLIRSCSFAGCSWVSSGLESASDGYRFSNGSDRTIDNDFGVWAAVFGSGPISTRYFNEIEKGNERPGVFGGGNCYGFSATALSFVPESFNRLSDLADQDSPPETLYDVDAGAYGLGGAHQDLDSAKPQLRDFIERYQVAQRMRSVQAKRREGVVGVVEQIKKGLREPGVASCLLGFSTRVRNGKPDPAGHAVVPLQVTQINEATTITVYDNNYPGRERSFIVDTGRGTWSYDIFLTAKGAAAETWSGGDDSIDCDTIGDVWTSLDDRSPGGPRVAAEDSAGWTQAPDLPPMASTINADARYLDAAGNRLGFFSNRLRDDIPGGSYVYPDPIGPQSRLERFVLPEDRALRLALKTRHSGTWSYSSALPTGGMTLSATAPKGAVTRPRLVGDDRAVTLTTTRQQRGLRVALARMVGPDLRVVGIADVTLSRATQLRVARAPGVDGVTVSGGATPRVYRAELSLYGTGQSYLSAPLTLRPNETQTVVARDWDNLDTSQIEQWRDANADGAPEIRVVIRPGTIGGGDAGSLLPWIVLGVTVVIIAAISVWVLQRLRRGD